MLEAKWKALELVPARRWCQIMHCWVMRKKSFATRRRHTRQVMQFCFILLQFHFEFAFLAFFSLLLLSIAVASLRNVKFGSSFNFFFAFWRGERFKFPSSRLEYLMEKEFHRFFCVEQIFGSIVSTATFSIVSLPSRKLELETHNGHEVDD